jgi:hypothetical protein
VDLRPDPSEDLGVTGLDRRDGSAFQPWIFPLRRWSGACAPPQRSDVDFIVKHSRERLTQKPPTASYKLQPQGGRPAHDPAIGADQR